MLRKHFLAVLSLLSATLFPALLPADVVYLNNGDKISGEIDNLAASKLTIDTEYAGKIKLDWAKIEHIESTGQFEVEVDSGRRYIGAIEKNRDDFRISREQGPVPVPSIAVVGFQPVKPDESMGFFQRLKGGVDLGYSITRGNSDLTQASLGIRGRYRKEMYEMYGSLNSIFSDQNGSRALSRHSVDGRFDRFLGPKKFAFAIVGMERNDRANLDLRTQLGGGLGWHVAKSRKTEFSVLGGFTLTTEKFRPLDDGMQPINNSGEALAGFEFRRIGLKGIELTADSSIHPNLVNTGRFRLESDAGIRVPLIGAIKWSISAFERFDSDPPVAVKRNDYGIVSALGYAF